MNIEVQGKKAIAAVASLERAGIGVVEVILARNAEKPFILIDSKDAQNLILTDKVKVKPGTYDRRMTKLGLISETYRVLYKDCVLWFTFLSEAHSTKHKGNAPLIN